MAGSKQRWWKRGLAAALGIVAGLAVCEGTLRTAGWLVRASSDRGGDVPAGVDGPVILCHGDSNVYGVYEPRERSYPARLEALIAAADPGRTPCVVNKGAPGLTARQLCSVLPLDLERTRPDALLVTVGANDFWAWRPEEDAAYASPPWYERLRLARVVRLFRYRLGDGRVDRAAHADLQLAAEGGEAGQVWTFSNRDGETLVRSSGTVSRPYASDDEYARHLHRQLAAIDAACREAGVALLLVGYGSDGTAYGESNGVARASARELGVPFVETAPALAELVARDGFAEVFWADLHPRGRGYEAIARLAFNALVEAGVCPGPALEAPLEGLSTDRAPEPEIRIAGRPAGAPGSDAALAVEIADEVPGRVFRVVFWDLHAGPAPPRRTYFEVLREDPTFRRCMRSPELLSRFDADGRGRVELAPFLGDDLEAVAGLRARVGYVVYADDEAQVLSRFSDPVVVQLD